MPDVEPNSFDDFMHRFWSLQEEADGYGIESVVVLGENDRLKREVSFNLGWKCGPATAIGMLERAKHRIHSTADEDKVE